MNIQVYKATRYEATVVALKVLVAGAKVTAKKILKAVELELQVMRKARHPHIVPCFGICVQVT